MRPPRPATPLTPAEADLSGAAIDAFAQALGGRTILLQTLLLASGSPEVDRVARLLEDPRYGGWSLRRICELAGLSIADLFTAYRKALLTQAHLIATRRIADALPGVVDDLLRRSQPHEESCVACRGTGTITAEPTKAQPNPAPEPCRSCAGAGTIRLLPDLDRQKVALELGQLLQSRAGISIQQNTLALPSGARALTGPGTLDALQQAVHALLYPRPDRGAPALPAAEAEVVEAEVAP